MNRKQIIITVALIAGALMTGAWSEQKSEAPPVGRYQLMEAHFGDGYELLRMDTATGEVEDHLTGQTWNRAIIF